MKDIFIVMKFTMKEMIKRKSFVISTLIILALIVVGFNVPNIINAIKGEDYLEKLLIIDNDNVFEGGLELLSSMDLDYDIKLSSDSFEQIKEKIDNDEIDSAIVIDKEENSIKMTYVVKSAVLLDGAPEDIINILSGLYSNQQIAKLNLTEEQIKLLTPDFEFDIKQTDEEASGNVLAIMLMSIVLFYAIYFCAYQVSSSITTEKTSKIMETLVTSTSPKTIILGKTIGIGIVRITTNGFNCWNSIG